MKKVKFCAICLCALALASCIKDADVLTSESVKSVESVSGNTTFTFTIENADDSTKGAVEDSGVHNQGIPEEYAVNNVDVYMFDAASGILAQTFSLQNVNLTVNTATDLVVEYESDKFDVEAGSYNILAVANSSSIYNVTTLEQFLAYEDDTYASTSLMSTIPSAGFIMTNRGATNQGVTISDNEDKEICITLERVVAKVDVAQNYDSFALSDATGATYATVKLQNYMLVNLATNYYLYRHVADLTTFSAPTYSYYLNYGDVSDVDGYVIDPYFFSKEASTVNAFTNADGFFFQPLAEVSTNPTWSMMPASTTSSVSYCLENTLYHEAQLNGYTTGIVFEAKVTPSAIINDASGSTTSATLTQVYYCSGKFYDSVATLEACLGGDVPNVDDSSSTADLEAAGITRLTLTNNDYTCYYNYWIKHYDNNDDQVMGAMEFGIVRNNHYQLSINSIAGLGTGEPTVIPDQPDETNETLKVTVEVIPWIVRDQGTVELK